MSSPQSQIDRIIAEDKRKREDAERKRQEQQQRINELQRRTGMGEYGKGGSKDVRAEAVAIAEAKVAAERQIISERQAVIAAETGGIKAGQRGTGGKRVTSATGIKPTPATEGEINVRAQEILKEKAAAESKRQAQERAREQFKAGLFNPQASISDVPRAQPTAVQRAAERDLESESVRRAQEQARLKVEFEAKTGEAQPFTEREQAAKQAQAKSRLGAYGSPTAEKKTTTVIQGLTIVGGEKSPTEKASLAPEQFKAKREALSASTRAEIAEAEKSLGYKYSGEVEFNPSTGEYSPLYFTPEAQKQRKEAGAAYKKALQDRNREISTFNRNAESDRKTLNEIAGRSGYDLKEITETDKATGTTSIRTDFIPKSGATEYKDVVFIDPTGKTAQQVRDEQNRLVTEAENKGAPVKETKLKSGVVVLEIGQPPKPEYKPNVAEQLYAGTIKYGGEAAAGIFELVGKGEQFIAEKTGLVTKEQSEAGGKRIEKAAEGIREATGYKTLSNLYQGLGDLTGRKEYKYAALDAARLAESEKEKPTGSIFGSAVAYTATGMETIAGRPLTEQESAKFRAQQEESFRERPIEFIAASAVDVLTFGAGGAGSIGKIKAPAGAIGKVTKGVSQSVGTVKFVTKKQIIRETEQALKETGEAVPKGGLEVVKVKVVKSTSGKFETVPVRERTIGDFFKTKGAKLVEPKKEKGFELPGLRKDVFEVITKEGKETVATATRGEVRVTGAPRTKAEQFAIVGQKEVTKIEKIEGGRVATVKKVEAVEPKKGKAFAKEGEQIRETETTGLRQAGKSTVADDELAKLQDISPGFKPRKTEAGVTTAEDVLGIKSKTGATQFIVEEGGGLRKVAEPKPVAELYTFGSKELESAAAVSIKEQSTGFFKTPKGIKRVEEQALGRPRLRLKERMTQRLLQRPRKKIEQIQERMQKIQQRIQNINQTIQDIRSQLDNPELTPQERLMLKRQLARAVEQRQQLVKMRQNLATKVDEFLEKIRKIQERRRLRRADFLGAKQEEYASELSLAKSPAEKLTKKKINKQSAAGASSVISPTPKGGQVVELVSQKTKTPAEIAAQEAARQKLLERTAQATEKRLGLGGGADRFTSKETLGLGGKTGREKVARKKLKLESEDIYLKYPRGFELGEKTPTAKAQRTSGFEIVGVKPITGGKFLEDLVKVPKTGQPQKEITLPKRTPGEKPITTPREDTITIPKITTTTRQDYITRTRQRTEQVTDRTTTTTPKIPRTTTTLKAPPIFFPGGGGGGSSGFGLGLGGATKVKKLGVVDPLTGLGNIMGEGVQKSKTEIKGLNIFAKPKGKKGKKKKFRV